MSCIRTMFLALALSAAVGASGCGSSSGGSGGGNTNGGGGATPQGGQAAVMVHIPVNAAGKGPAAYGTNPLVIPVGTAVQWMNDDSMAHTATSDSGVWDSGTLNPGQTFSHTFSTPGTFPYHCTIHGAASMSGTIQVSAAPSPTSSPSPSGGSGGGGGGY